MTYAIIHISFEYTICPLTKRREGRARHRCDVCHVTCDTPSCGECTVDSRTRPERLSIALKERREWRARRCAITKSKMLSKTLYNKKEQDVEQDVVQ